MVRGKHGSGMSRVSLVVALVVTIAACTSSPPVELAVSTTRPAATSSPSTTSGSPSTTVPTVTGEGVETVLYNGQIVTVDGDFSVAEGLAIEGGDVVAVGSSIEVLGLAGTNTVTVDLEGRTVIPGFIDPHTHLLQAPAPDLDGMRSAQSEMVRFGTTTVGTPSIEPEELDAYRVMDEAGELVVRTHLYPLYNTVCGGRDFGDFYKEHPFTRDPDLKLAVAGVKIFADGGVCNAPAVSFEYPETVPAYLRDSGWVDQGSLYVTAEEIASVVREIDAASGYVVVHGIGDAGIRTALAGLNAGLNGLPSANPHRVDHNSMAPLLSEDELGIYGTLRMIPIIQLMPWASACDEGRSELWASILPEPAYSSIEDRRAIAARNPGIRFAWHGDNPWLPGSPLQQMFSIVTGGAVQADTGEVCYPEAWDWFPTVTVEDALRLMTVNAAAAMGIERRVGSLEPGKVADLLILANDIRGEDPESAIAANYPALTMIDGEVHFCEGDLCDRFPNSASEESAAPVDGWIPVDHPLVVAVRASMEYESAARAFDGSSDTGWVSGDSSPQWIELELIAASQDLRLSMIVDQDPPGFTVHRVYAGLEPNPSELIAEISGETSWGDVLELAIVEEVRFIRVETPDSPSWVAWGEIQVRLPG